MKAHFVRNILVVIVGLLVIAAVWQAVKALPQPAAPWGNATSTEPASSSTAPASMQVKVALLDYSGEKPGKQRGCDRVLLVDRTVASTSMPLTAALQELFAIPDEQVDGLDNFIPRTRETLAFESATVQDGVARIYLVGKLSGLAGVCDDPRAKIQIEETALQFPTVQTVELYLNGQKTDLQPSQK